MRNSMHAHSRPYARIVAAVVAMACLCIVVLPILSPTRAGASVPTAPSSVLVVADRTTVDYNGIVRFTGRLSVEGTSSAHAAIHVSFSNNSTSWTRSADVATGPDGSFGYTSPPLSQNTTFRFEFLGDSGRAPFAATSNVSVRARLARPYVPVTVTKDRKFTVSGKLAPRHPDGSSGVTLYCYRFERGKWILKKKVSAGVADEGSASGYSANVSLAPSGKWRIRARHKDADHALTWSTNSRTIAVRSRADATIWNRDGISTIPERMSYRRNARQMIVATGSRLGARYGRVRLYEYRDGDWVSLLSVPCRFGVNGLTDGRTRRSGTLTTPTGIWRMPDYVFGQHSRPPRGTTMSYRRITSRSWWSAERNSTYNSWVETSRYVYGERLINYRVPYEWAVSTGYNALPNKRVYGRGSAIFLHAHGRDLTAGCISVSADDMAKIFKLLDPQKRRVFAAGTTKTASATSIYSY